MRILVIQEGTTAPTPTGACLSGDGHDVHTTRSREEGLARAAAEPFDAVVIDVGRNGRHGPMVAARLRDLGLAVPVVVVAIHGDDEDHVGCLDSGADDYLVAPFTVAGLTARLRAMKRRATGTGDRRLAVADLDVDLDTRSAWRAGRRVQLTAREFELLAYLLRHKGRVVTRQMLARDVWKEPSRGTPLDNVVAVHVARIRRKLHRDDGPHLIHTVRGVGFIAGVDGAPSRRVTPAPAGPSDGVE